MNLPANLTPQYLQAERRFRRASTLDEELSALQLMLVELPKHKGTDKLQADLKQRISRTKKRLLESKSSAAGRPGFHLPRQGAGRVVVVGGPNSGKSQLLKTLTRARPEIAEFPFTTREPMPGMMPWEDVFVQLIDTPPITKDFLEHDVQELIRNSDLALLLIDLNSDEGVEQLIEVENRIAATKTRFANQSYLDPDDVGVSYTRTVFVENKTDAVGAMERLEILREFHPVPYETVAVSAILGNGIDELRKKIFNALDVVRVYTKMPNEKEPNFEKPFTIKRGETLLQVAELIHHDLAENFKSARVWGANVHDGTYVKGDYVVSDKDVVEIHR